MTNSSDSVDQPLVSVVIPTYNRSKELSRAIKSVLSQTYQNFEILVVDDGSEEDLRIVCDSFNDNRIRFYRNEQHTNANVARNRGIKEAKGEYIAMLDSDDEYMPHHLQRRIEKIKEWKCDGIFGSAYVFDGENKNLKLSRPRRANEKMSDYLFDNGSATTPSHFYSKKSALDILWDESLHRHQDYDFSIRYANKFEFKSDYTPSVVIHWIKGEKRTHNFDSYIQFILNHENNIAKNLLSNYCWQMYTLAKSENENKAQKFYFNRIKKNIKHITPSQWFGINNVKSSFTKPIYFVIYFILLLINR